MYSGLGKKLWDVRPRTGTWLKHPFRENLQRFPRKLAKISQNLAKQIPDYGFASEMEWYSANLWWNVTTRLESQIKHIQFFLRRFICSCFQTSNVKPIFEIWSGSPLKACQVQSNPTKPKLLTTQISLGEQPFYISCQMLSLFRFDICYDTGRFFHWYPPKKFKYGKPRLGESTLT